MFNLNKTHLGKSLGCSGSHRFTVVLRPVGSQKLSEFRKRPVLGTTYKSSCKPLEQTGWGGGGGERKANFQKRNKALHAESNGRAERVESLPESPEQPEVESQGQNQSQADKRNR